MLRPRSQPTARRRLSAAATLLVVVLLAAWALLAQFPSSAGRDAESMSTTQLSTGQRFIATEVAALAQAELEDTGLPEEDITRAQVITLMTVLQESSLRNLDHGDADSKGLFQQRPSMDWGTAEQVRDPRWAVAAFLGTNAEVSNPGLLDIEGWQRMAPNDAAQEVQRSAHPEQYGRWEPLAESLVEEAGPRYAVSATTSAGS